ncbi:MULTISPECIES: ABC transporter ATP-binding protein [Clavibacter]|uniref:ATP-binding cassette domain-containing protein n=2 Tax=Clavibacter TaxID=1573 RepID=A0A399P2U5_9MICO|nr:MULTISPECIES: ATP-binding cassette domain-containing protein [Clavibacter]RII99096.1 ATP-binding cassette domain-containing protein [Clavibacter michiganensis]UKF26715.1 ATP-binding cassette domain-containing protein [Clavibacter sp. A6099]
MTISAPEFQRRPHRGEVLFAAQGVTFGYDTDNPILSEWSAQFASGEVVAITGRSGRGKSTLLYILGLMLKPTKGALLVRGQNAIKFNDAQKSALRAQTFGFVFQDAALDPTRTVLDNVTETTLYRGTSRKSDRLKALHLMEQFGVNLRANGKPGQVSGGQAQRIALCRALLNDPLILLADEPTGNLDADSSALVVKAFHEQAAAGSAVVVVTHDPALVSQCHRTIRL